MNLGSLPSIKIFNFVFEICQEVEGEKGKKELYIRNEES